MYVIRKAVSHVVIRIDIAHPKAPIFYMYTHYSHVTFVCSIYISIVIQRAYAMPYYRNSLCENAQNALMIKNPNIVSL